MTKTLERICKTTRSGAKTLTSLSWARKSNITRHIVGLNTVVERKAVLGLKDTLVYPSPPPRVTETIHRRQFVDSMISSVYCHKSNTLVDPSVFIGSVIPSSGEPNKLHASQNTNY